jgi:hypothetical protein
MAKAHTGTIHPQGETAPSLTLARARAIRAAMRSFLDDAVSDGESLPPPRWCDRCRDLRPAAGWISYQQTDLCNRCATAYELYRAAGRARSPEEFVALRRTRTPRRPVPTRKE